MDKNKQKVVIIGIDGAPFEIIDKWSKDLHLPNIKKIIDDGVFGCLQSSFLPTSPIAWTSIVTGKNSGKHNVFDWGYREKDTYKIRSVNSTNVRSAYIWDILNSQDKTAGIFNIPVTYPPPIPVNEFLVSGFDTPNTKVCFTHPEDLTKKIINHVTDYVLAFREAYTPGQEKLFIEDLKQIIEIKKETIFYLIDNYDPDFYLFVLMELDHLHHKMWKFINDDEKKDYLYEVYQAIDKVIGEIVDKFSENTTFFLISDHGAGPLEGIMYINKWLYQIGLLNFKKKPTLFFKTFLEKTNIISNIYNMFSKLGLGKILRSLPKSIQGIAATSFMSFDDIDWNKTKAYSFGRYGQIYINLEGREPCGIVKPGNEYENLVNFLIHELSQIKNQYTGKKMISKICRKEEVYSGSFIKNAPDVLFEIKGLSYNSSVKFGLKKKSIFDEPEFSDSGTHRREGIIIAKGKNIKKGASVNHATILDITPTILYLMGIEIPSDIDGKVIEDIFTDEFKNEYMPLFTQNLGTQSIAKNREISNDEEEEIKRKLESLGYFG